MNKRQKLIASCMIPTYGGLAKPDEIKKIKLMARGHYWSDKDYQELVAFSPTGRRAFFEYELWSPAHKKLQAKWMKLAVKAAKLWTKGKYKEAKAAHNLMWGIRE